MTTAEIHVDQDEQLEFSRRLSAATVAETVVEPRTVDGKRVVWAPQAGSQTAFLNCPMFEALYHGTRGPGKSDALLMSFAMHVGRGHGAAWRGVLFRRTYPELADIVAKTRKWFSLIFPRAEFNQSKMIWRWPDGEELLLRHIAVPDDYYHYHGHEYPWIAFEELTTWPSADCYTPMFACCRSSVAGVPRMIRATTNPHGCVPYGEVLTATKGWVPIQDIPVGEKVVSVDEYGAACVREVSGVTHAPYEGDMMRRSGRGLTMVFTPQHRFPHLNTAGGRHTVKGYEDLPGQANIRRTAVSWGDGEPATEICGFDAGDLMEFAGWFLSEGYVLRRHAPNRVAERELGVAQVKPDNRRRIGELLDRMGVRWRVDPKTFHISDPRLYGMFSSQGYSHEKHVPRRLLKLSRALLERMLESLMLGDGCNGVYYTNSKQLADDVAEIAVKVGLTAYTSSRMRENRTKRTYQVNMSRRGNVWLHTGNHVYDVESTSKSLNVHPEPFDGTVYCLTVPGTETFFVRQDGCVWLSGNTGHGWVADRFRLRGQWSRTIVVRDAQDHEGHIEPPRAAIHGHLSENKLLLEADPNYATTISAAATSPAMREAWLSGSWDVVAGGMFDDVWDRNVNIVPKFEVPASWKVDRAFDWGSSRPFSVAWYAQSDGTDLRFPDGQVARTVRGDVFMIQEWYGWTGKPNTGLRMLAVDVARGIVERELRWGLRKDRWSRVYPGPADSAIWTTENGVNIALDMSRVVTIEGVKYPGVQWTQADKRPGSRKTGWEHMRKMMAAAKAPEGQIRESPGFFVVGERCPQFLRTVPAMARDLKDPDDIPTKDVEDHIADQVRYRLHTVGAEFRSGRTVGMT